MLFVGYFVGRMTQKLPITSLHKNFHLAKIKGVFAEASSQSSQVSDAKLLNDLLELRKRNARLLAEIEGLKNQGVVGTISTKIIDAKILSDDFKVHPEIIELLELTNEEKGKLDEIFQQLREDIIQTIKGKVSVKASSPTSVTLMVLPFPDEARYILQQLYSAVQFVLGRDRFALFREISLKQWRGHKLLNPFQGLGTAEQTITFLVDSENNSPSYTVRTESTIGGETFSGPRLPTDYQIFESWLPPTFQKAFAKPSTLGESKRESSWGATCNHIHGYDHGS